MLREYTYVQIHNFCKIRHADLPKLYNDHFDTYLKKKWELNRIYFSSDDAQDNKLLRSNYNFFIDLFLNDESNSLFPFTSFDSILKYIRENRSAKDMKFLIFYLISKELNQYDKLSEELKADFCHIFELVKIFPQINPETDQELVFFNGLTRLDMIIEKYILTKDPLDRDYLRLAKEACL